MSKTRDGKTVKVGWSSEIIYSSLGINQNLCEVSEDVETRNGSSVLTLRIVEVGRNSDNGIGDSRNDVLSLNIHYVIYYGVIPHDD